MKTWFVRLLLAVAVLAAPSAWSAVSCSLTASPAQVKGFYSAFQFANVDMQGTFDFATASSSSRTPGERYCGSCMARPTRS